MDCVCFREHPDKVRVGLHNENLLLRSCTVRNTETVIGIVVYAGTVYEINIIQYADNNMNSSSCTMGIMDYLNGLKSLCVCAGHETKAMQNNSGPRYKRSKLERKLNMDIIWSVVLLLLMCVTSAVGKNKHTHTHTHTYLIL